MMKSILFSLAAATLALASSAVTSIAKETHWRNTLGQPLFARPAPRVTGFIQRRTREDRRVAGDFRPFNSQKIGRRNYRAPSRLGRVHQAPASRHDRWQDRRVPSHYTYRDFPYWAARALEPARTR